MREFAVDGYLFTIEVNKEWSDAEISVRKIDPMGRHYLIEDPPSYLIPLPLLNSEG